MVRSLLIDDVRRGSLAFGRIAATAPFQDRAGRAGGPSALAPVDHPQAAGRP